MSVSIDPISRHLVASWPARHFLSNGRYHCWLSPSGSGRSQIDRRDLLTWSPERLADLSGLFIYLRDLPEGTTRSITPRPCGRAEDPLEVLRDAGQVRFTRQEAGLEARLDVCVPADDSGELRCVRLRNTGDQPRVIELTTYGEVALQETAAHAGHPEFSRLFVRSEVEADVRALFFRRRPRANGEFHPWMVHALLEPGEVTWETDRGRFLGRGGSPRSPLALHDARPLSGTTGDVLDPAMALRTVVRLQPGEEAQRTFFLGGAPDRDAARALVTKLQTPAAIANAFAAASRRESALWSSLGLDVHQVKTYEALAGALLYGDPAVAGGPDPSALLARHGADRRTPCLRVDVDSHDAAEPFRGMARYWHALGLPFGLVAATRSEAWDLSAEVALEASSNRTSDLASDGTSGRAADDAAEESAP